MMNYDMQQASCVPQSATNNTNSNRVSPHLYYQQQHHHHQQQQHHRPKNAPFSPTISLATNNGRSSINDTNSGPNPLISKTPNPSQQQRSVDYASSSPCPEPSLKHARFDSSIWPNAT
jgi:hypothetical protein